MSADASGLTMVRVVLLPPPLLPSLLPPLLPLLPPLADCDTVAVAPGCLMQPEASLVTS